jgi:peroxiredoxin
VRTDSRDDIHKEKSHALLHQGDTFPQLTLNVPGAHAIQVPGWFAGEFGVVLFNRGAWCPYCTAELRGFQRAGEALAAAGIRVAALWVDDEQTEDVTGLVGYLRAHAAASSG